MTIEDRLSSLLSLLDLTPKEGRQQVLKDALAIVWDEGLDFTGDALRAGCSLEEAASGNPYRIMETPKKLETAELQARDRQICMLFAEKVLSLYRGEGEISWVYIERDLDAIKASVLKELGWPDEPANEADPDNG